VRAYADTSAFIAFRDASDTYHPLFGRLFSDPPLLITSSLVVAEGQAWFLKRYDATRALQFMNFIEGLEKLSVFSVGSREIKAATELLQKFSDQNLTLADALGLWIMEKEKITTCWSTDFHLGLTGRALVIHKG